MKIFKSFLAALFVFLTVIAFGITSYLLCCGLAIVAFLYVMITDRIKDNRDNMLVDGLKGDLTNIVESVSEKFVEQNKLIEQLSTQLSLHIDNNGEIIKSQVYDSSANIINALNALFQQNEKTKEQLFYSLSSIKQSIEEELKILKDSLDNNAITLIHKSEESISTNNKLIDEIKGICSEIEVIKQLPFVIKNEFEKMSSQNNHFVDQTIKVISDGIENFAENSTKYRDDMKTELSICFRKFVDDSKTLICDSMEDFGDEIDEKFNDIQIKSKNYFDNASKIISEMTTSIFEINSKTEKVLKTLHSEIDDTYIKLGVTLDNLNKTLKDNLSIIKKEESLNAKENDLVNKLLKKISL